MNTTTVVEEPCEEENGVECPGANLARVRKNLNISQEYIAEKLHLRVAVIELLEADEYEKMPEPVFVKGYIRGYAKLLDMDPEPLLDSFNQICKVETVIDKTPLWQPKKENNLAEYMVKWLTVAFAIAVIIAVSIWWHKSKDNHAELLSSVSNTAVHTTESELQVTGLSNMKHLTSIGED